MSRDAIKDDATVPSYVRRGILLRSLPVLARSPFALLALCLTWVSACGPTASGDAPCGQFDLTQNGPAEMCGSMSACPGTDLCVGGFCIGSVCETGTCEPAVGTAYACKTGPADSGTSQDAAADAPADSSSPNVADASKDVAAGQ